MPWNHGGAERLSVPAVVSKLPSVLADIAKLKNPVLDATILATLVAVVSPFGLNVGPDGAIISGVLAAVGTAAAAVEAVIADLKSKPAPVPTGFSFVPRNDTNKSAVSNLGDNDNGL